MSLTKCFYTSVCSLFLFSSSVLAQAPPQAPAAAPAPAPAPAPAAPAFESTEGWNKARWGMSPERVGQIYASAKGTESGMFMKGNVFGKNAAVVLQFAQNMLCQVEISFTDEHKTDPSGYYEDYDAIKAAVTRAYDDPLTDDMNWKDETLSQDESKWGAAIAYGDLDLEATWVTDKTSVALRCKGQDFKVSTTVTYTSKELSKLLAGQEDLFRGKGKVLVEADQAPPAGSTGGKTVDLAALQKVKPYVQDAELKARYELVKSGQKHRGKEIGAEALVALGAEGWPATFTPEPPGPRVVGVTTDMLQVVSCLPALSKGDYSSMSDLAAQGTVFFVPNLTKVTVSNCQKVTSYEATEVKIAEGPDAGKSGWVLTEWVY